MRARGVITVLGALAVASIGRTAHATPDFPGVVQEVVGSKATPACTICHNSLTGGFGTVTTPFGVYLRSRGLVAADEGSLRSALAAALAEKHDSNGDGITDIDALKAGNDPNATAGSNAEAAEEYGCGRVAGHRSGGGDAWLALPLIAALVVARRMRRLAPSRGLGGLRR